MSSILNALFGHRKDKDDKKQQDKVETTTTASSSSGSHVVSHTAVKDDVHVRSVVSSESNASVSMENSKKITDLMSKLGKKKIFLLYFSIGLKTFQEQHIVKWMNIQKNEQLKSVKL